MSTDPDAHATAVDVLLEPDATMIGRATAANDRLRTNFPGGFALDAAHRPHITMVQGYFATNQLVEMFASVERVVELEPIASWQLSAIGYYYLPWMNLGAAGIVIARSPELVNLQQALLNAVAPFETRPGTAAAFVTTPDDPEINQGTIDYVANFSEEAAGEHFNPHVTIGLALQDYLDAMLDEPFDEFTFSATSAAAYQLGNFGTASRLLQQWKLHQ